MSDLLDITPLVTVDFALLTRNIDEMARLAVQQGIALRPHVKTHKSPALAQLQLERGASGITVATLREAEVMAASGCRDILIAYTVVGPDKNPRLIALARQVKLAVAVDSVVGAKALGDAFAGAGTVLEVMIEVDTGQHRCGVSPGDAVVKLAREIAAFEGIRIRGIMTHEGHAYGRPTIQEIAEVARRAAQDMRMTAALLNAAGIPCPIVSMGSTPTARFVAAEPGVTEIRPGNYVFYDHMQMVMGVVPWDRCALRVNARVISRPSPDRAVLDCGSKTLSSDQGKHGPVAHGYGLLLKDGQPVNGAVLERLSEEHGVASLPPETDLSVGDLVQVIPNHACPVANLADNLVIVDRGRVIDTYPVEA